MSDTPGATGDKDTTIEVKDSSSESVSQNVPNSQPARTSGIKLVPEPTHDSEDPLNWPMSKKIRIFVCICLAAFAGQMSPNSNQLTFVLQVPTYQKTNADLLNSVAAGLAGWMAGPFIFAPLSAIIGRTAVIFWALIGTFACQIWAANMTGQDDYIPFTISRLICGLFGVVPAILGNGFIIDMFFLHQRGKAFAVYEVLVIFAVVGMGTIGGFIANFRPWEYVFWWTLGPVGAAIIAVFLFVEDTSFDRQAGTRSRPPLPKNFIADRIATFFPGTKTQPRGKLSEWKRQTITPLQITFTPITLLVGLFVFVALGLPIMQASTLAIYLQPPVEAGGYGFSPLQLAFFTMTAWVGIIGAQVCGYAFNDKIPLWISSRTGGVWHPEYRLANTLVPGILLPIGLGLWGAGLQYHLHFMVLVVASFLIWFAALLALPVCYNYIIECFLKTPVEASVALNSYRIAFGLLSVFVATEWQLAVGVGWMWGMGAFFVVFVDMIMLAVVFKGHVFRGWSALVSKKLAATEDGMVITSDNVNQGRA